MMHHVAGECKQPQSLLQAPIIQTFINILDTASSKIIPQVPFDLLWPAAALHGSLPQEGHDLMEFILQKCLDTDPLSFVCLLSGIDLAEMEAAASQELAKNEQAQYVASSVYFALPGCPFNRSQSPRNNSEFAPWSHEEEDELLALASQQDAGPDVDDLVLQLHRLNIDKSCNDVWHELCRHGLVSEDKLEVEKVRLNFFSHFVYMPISIVQFQSSDGTDVRTQLLQMPKDMRIDKCVQHLTQEGHSDWLLWLQSAILEVIYVKVVPDICQIRPKEPVSWHCSCVYLCVCVENLLDSCLQ